MKSEEMKSINLYDYPAVRDNFKIWYANQDFGRSTYADLVPFTDIVNEHTIYGFESLPLAMQIGIYEDYLDSFELIIHHQYDYQKDNNRKFIGMVSDNTFEGKRYYATESLSHSPSRNIVRVESLTNAFMKLNSRLSQGRDN